MKLIKEKSDHGVLRLIMNNSDQGNALSESMMSILMDEIKGASSDQSIKVIVIAANGNVFCSGHDLKEITAARENEDSGEAYFKNLFDICSSWPNADKVLFICAALITTKALSLTNILSFFLVPSLTFSFSFL